MGRHDCKERGKRWKGVSKVGRESDVDFAPACALSKSATIGSRLV